MNQESGINLDELQQLQGEWRVLGIGLLEKLFAAIDDRKIISGDHGHNVAEKLDFKGGYFRIEPLTNGIGFKLIYDDERNPLLLRDIVDTIVPRLDGSFFGSLLKGGHFQFHFLLVRVEHA